jgi:hypothetical protein
MSTPANKRGQSARPSVNFRRPILNFQDLESNRATAISLCAASRRGWARSLRLDPLRKALITWRECNRHALREFWARAPADALGVKQELEKALAQNGKPAK